MTIEEPRKHKVATIAPRTSHVETFLERLELVGGSLDIVRAQNHQEVGMRGG